jgi:hypothetical protein
VKFVTRLECYAPHLCAEGTNDGGHMKTLAWARRLEKLAEQADDEGRYELAEALASMSVGLAEEPDEADWTRDPQ